MAGVAVAAPEDMRRIVEIEGDQVAAGRGAGAERQVPARPVVERAHQDIGAAGPHRAEQRPAAPRRGAARPRRWSASAWPVCSLVKVDGVKDCPPLLVSQIALSRKREREAVPVGRAEHEGRDAAVGEVRAAEALGGERPARAVVGGPVVVRRRRQAGLPAAEPGVAGGGMEGRMREVVHHQRRVAEAGPPLDVRVGGLGEALAAVGGVFRPLLTALLAVDQDHVARVVGVHLQLGEAALAAHPAPARPAVGGPVDAAADADDDRLAVGRDIGLARHAALRQAAAGRSAW